MVSAVEFGKDLEMGSIEGPEGIKILSLRGEIDLHSGRDLDLEFERLRAEGTTRVVVDVSGVSYMDSSGLRVLVKAQRAFEEVRGGLALAAAGDRVLKVIRLTGMTEVLPCHPTVEAGAASLRGRCGTG